MRDLIDKWPSPYQEKASTTPDDGLNDIRRVGDAPGLALVGTMIRGMLIHNWSWGTEHQRTPQLKHDLNLSRQMLQL